MVHVLLLSPYRSDSSQHRGCRIAGPNQLLDCMSQMKILILFFKDISIKASETKFHRQIRVKTVLNACSLEQFKIN